MTTRPLYISSRVCSAQRSPLPPVLPLLLLSLGLSAVAHSAVIQARPKDVAAAENKDDVMLASQDDVTESGNRLEDIAELDTTTTTTTTTMTTTTTAPGSQCTVEPTAMFNCRKSQPQIYCFLQPPHTPLTPGPASNLAVSIHEDEEQGGTHLEVRWGLPADGTVALLEGFALEVYSMSGAVGALSCVTMEISEGSWQLMEDGSSSSISSITFLHQVPDVETGHDYRVVVRSLPLAADFSNVVSKSVTVPQREEELAPAEWRANISHLAVTDTSVRFEYKVAPAQYGFTTYNMELLVCQENSAQDVGSSHCEGVDREQLISWEASESLSGRSGHTFEELRMGVVYQIRVRPSSRSSEDGSCVCIYWDTCACASGRSDLFMAETPAPVIMIHS